MWYEGRYLDNKGLDFFGKVSEEAMIYLKIASIQA